MIPPLTRKRLSFTIIEFYFDVKDVPGSDGKRLSAKYHVQQLNSFARSMGQLQVRLRKEYDVHRK